MSGIESLFALFGLNVVCYYLYAIIDFLQYNADGIAKKILYVLAIPVFVLGIPTSFILEGIVNHYLDLSCGSIMEKVKRDEEEKEEKRREEWRKQDENSRIHMEIQMEIAKDRAAKRERAAIAQRLLADGEPVEKITRCTGLSASDVKYLAQQKSG